MGQDIIASRMTALGHAADALLERETLTGEELSDILSRFPPSQPPADLQSYIVRAPRNFSPLLCSSVRFCTRGYAGCCFAESFWIQIHVSYWTAGLYCRKYISAVPAAAGFGASQELIVHTVCLQEEMSADFAKESPAAALLESVTR